MLKHIKTDSQRSGYSCYKKLLLVSTWKSQMINIHPSELQLFQQCLVRDLRILTLPITALLFTAAGLKAAPEWQIFWWAGALCICSPLVYATRFSLSICLFLSSVSLRFSIDPQSDPEALFRITPDTGLITTVTELDREHEQWHNITIIATQRGTHTQSQR